MIFCNNDAMAMGALQAIEAAGRKVGQDIYLVGVDALEEAVQAEEAAAETETAAETEAAAGEESSSQDWWTSLFG